MPPFDMGSAVESVGAGLGLEDPSPESVDSTDLPPSEEESHSQEDSADDVATPSENSGEAPEGEDEGDGQEEKLTDPAPSPEEVLQPPRTWRAEAAAEFSKLPPVVQQEILKREEDIFKGIEGYKADAAFGNQLKSVMTPYLPILKQYNIAPEAQIQSLMQANHTLAFGTPEAKVQLLRNIARDYQIDLSGLGEASFDEDFSDPAVKALQSELQSIKSQLQQSQQSQVEARKAEIEQTVNAFAADPANRYFEEVSEDIAKLLSTGAETDLKAAYDKAVWMNPAVRAKELARQQAEKQEAERKLQKEKAEAARKASAANVRTRAKSGSATAPTGSMDDTLAEALTAIKARG